MVLSPNPSAIIWIDSLIILITQYNAAHLKRIIDVHLEEGFEATKNQEKESSEF